MGNTHFHKRYFSIPVQHFSSVKTRVTYNWDKNKNAMCGKLAAAVGTKRLASLLVPGLEGLRHWTAPSCAFAVPIARKAVVDLWARLLFGK